MLNEYDLKLQLILNNNVELKRHENDIKATNKLLRDATVPIEICRHKLKLQHAELHRRKLASENRQHTIDAGMLHDKIVGLFVDNRPSISTTLLDSNEV